MIDLTLLAAVQATVPATPGWNPTVGIIMTVFNIVGLIVASRGVERPGVGPSLPFSLPGFGKKLSLGQFIAGMSFGHILGTGAILGLTYTGLL